jgi:hypothetical protein
MKIKCETIAFRSRSPLRAGKGRLVGYRREANKERRRKTPADFALISEGLQLRNRSGWRGEPKREPRQNLRLWRGFGLGPMSRIRIFASALGPA